MEERELKDIVRKAAQNLIWLAARVHEAHHARPDSDPWTGPDDSWRECNRGVCASMEYMLGQAGFDKNLKPVPVMP